MKQTREFKNIWTGLVSRGEISGEYNGGKTFIGIELRDGKPQYYARQIQDNGEIKDLPQKVEEKFIPQTDFVVQYNVPRSYRPGSSIPIAYEGRVDAPKEGAEYCKFFCMDSSKKLSMSTRELSGQFIMENRRYNLYHNAFPIEEEGHFMLIPSIKQGTKEILPHMGQRLSRQVIEDVVQLAKHSQETIFFFNSLHAGATVDHLHIQQIHYRRALKNGTPLINNVLAVENSAYETKIQRKVLVNYPAGGIFYPSSESSDFTRDIEVLQDNDRPFNWIVMGEKVYLFPRKLEKVRELPDIPASSEHFGRIITTDRDLYDNISKDLLWKAYDKTTFRNLDEILDQLNLTGGKK